MTFILRPLEAPKLLSLPEEISPVKPRSCRPLASWILGEVFAREASRRQRDQPPTREAPASVLRELGDDSLHDKSPAPIKETKHEATNYNLERQEAQSSPRRGGTHNARRQSAVRSGTLRSDESPNRALRPPSRTRPPFSPFETAADASTAACGTCGPHPPPGTWRSTRTARQTNQLCRSRPPHSNLDPPKSHGLFPERFEGSPQRFDSPFPREEATSDILGLLRRGELTPLLDADGNLSDLAPLAYGAAQNPRNFRA